MNNLINKNINELVTPEIINFTELVKSSNTTLSLNLQTKLADKLKEMFTEEEQHWYVANLYMYMNYHPTDDYPINLEHVFKMIGFANKGNAMKTIKSNFIENEDYKSSLLPKEKSSWGGSGKEEIMLNVDTFNNSKQIRQIHPITKNVIIFNSLSEIYIKFGIASKTIIKAIESKCLYNGYLWEYNL